MRDDIRHHLPGYVAGSLTSDLHARVEDAVVGSPELLAEAMELIAVNVRLLDVRRAIDEDAAAGG